LVARWVALSCHIVVRVDWGRGNEGFLYISDHRELALLGQAPSAMWRRRKRKRDIGGGLVPN